LPSCSLCWATRTRGRCSRGGSIRKFRRVSDGSGMEKVRLLRNSGDGRWRWSYSGISVLCFPYYIQLGERAFTKDSDESVLMTMPR
jgi:hypothetical protein